RQLLALARAVAGEPRVLVLDEATSSVDPVSERLIQKALPRVMAGRTSLVVAHRLSTIQRADNILVMHQGRVVEQGRHLELMDLDGLYARLVRLQRLKKKEGHHADGD
ncbi:MAG: ABC transporter ATP-binding protein, partial [Proteobacteria bacterium]|nr:ABC transporter ATP-binding protein [Pseudomonadota bacterium]